MQVGSRARRAVRWWALMVRPVWATARISTPLVTMTLRIQTAGHRYGDRPDPGDLTTLLADRVATNEGVVVDRHVHHRFWPRRLLAARRGGAGQVDQGVGPVGVVTFVPAAGPGVAFHLRAAGIDFGQQ